jgi:hypothetical protein
MGVQELRPNDNQYIIATETIGTMRTLSTDTKVGADRTPTSVHCTRNNTTHKLIATSFKNLKERFSHKTELAVHVLQFTIVHQPEEISEMKTLDTFLEVNTQTD